MVHITGLPPFSPTACLTVRDAVALFTSWAQPLPIVLMVGLAGDHTNAFIPRFGPVVAWKKPTIVRLALIPSAYASGLPSEPIPGDTDSDQCQAVRRQLPHSWRPPTTSVPMIAAATVMPAETAPGITTAWFQAFRAFLAGDVTTSERLYHEVLNRWPDDVHAYVGVGLMLLILNPLRGRSAEESLAPLRYARILDPENIDARMMLAYLTSRREHYDELESLRTWLPAESDYTLIIASCLATVGRDPAELARIRGVLEGAPDLLVHECCRYAAVMGHDLDESQRLAGLLTHATRSPAVRATGHVLIAQIHLVRGCPRASRAEFSTARSFAPVQSGVYHALAAVLPMFEWSRTELTALRLQVAAWDVESQSHNGTGHLPFLVHSKVYPELRQYLLGLLDLRLGEPEAALGHAEQLGRRGETLEAQSLAFDLSLSIRAQVALAEGNSAAALALLEQTRLQPPYEGVQMQSPFFSENLERYLRARLLEESGRLDEALHWYDSLCENGLHEFVHLAPSHFRRGVIHRRLGHQEQATEHFLKVTELWQNADPELQPLVEEAAAVRGSRPEGAP